MPRRVIVFDVNETLLDLSALDTPFEAAFGSAEARSAWFAQLLNLAMTSVLTGAYHDFSKLGRAALHMVAAKRSVALSDEAVDGIVERMRHLPPHPDAVPALEALRAAGFRLAALTNSAPRVARAQLGNAGLADYFERILSVDEAQCFKPAAPPYRMAAERLDVTSADMRMVAVHDWDVIGAMAAGCAGAFVARAGTVFNPLARKPDVTGRDLEAVAERIVQVDQ
jgi:2-haloacid dehalogenase